MNEFTSIYQTGLERTCPRKLASLLNVNTERELQREIVDITHELSIMINIIRELQGVTGRFIKLAKEIVGGVSPDIQLLEDGQIVENSQLLQAERTKTSKTTVSPRASTFENRAIELQLEMNDKIVELERLKTSAESIVSLPNPRPELTFLPLRR